MRYLTLSSSHQLARAMVCVSFLGGLLACTDAAETPQPSQNTESAEYAEQQESYEGVWRITDAKFSDVSVMDMEEAQKWFGDEVRLNASQVRFQNEVCDQPSFHVNTLNEDEFYTYFRTRFDSLDFEGETVDVIEVGCPDYWGVPGAMLVRVSNNLAYLPWDGVFFQVEKAN